MSELEQARAEKDEFFGKDPDFPLSDEQKRVFKGLRYFPENAALRFEVPIEWEQNPRQVVMQTSTGGVQKHQHVGQVRFTVGSREVTLQVYKHERGYLVPFVDATAPGETYGAGRYLEPHDHEFGSLHLDFNDAHNPYCAYNEKWSCPVPPKENHLEVRIEAGEKKFQG